MTDGPELNPVLTASKAWGELAKVFAAARVDTPVIDARLLVCHALGLDRAELIKEPNRPLGEHAEALLLAARRRLAREPVSRIIGERAFHGRQFVVTPATLDPRPDSETLIDAAFHLYRRRAPPVAPRVLDLGTGTGCLLLTLLAEIPSARGMGIDISPDALAVARLNAERLQLADRVDFRQGDWGSGADAAFDLVFANPPYIPTDDIDGLAPEVTQYDPRLALDGGADGLTAYRGILATPPRLTPGGSLLFEVGAGQAADVAALLRDRLVEAQPEIVVFRDLAGIERVISATVSADA